MDSREASTPSPPASPRWVHRLAIATACATFPLIVLGGLVTTYDVGMAVWDAPTTFGQNMLLYPLSEWLHNSFGVKLEHGHRLFGALVGLLTLVLAAGLWADSPRRWLPWLGAIALAAAFAGGMFKANGLLAVGGLTMLVAIYFWANDRVHWQRWLGLLALGLVLLQGGLGALRVVLHERQLAVVHGCVAQAFFVLTAALALITAQGWGDASKKVECGDAKRLQRLGLITTGFVFLQLLFGAILRHLGIVWALYAHLTVAFIIIVHVGLIAKRVFIGHSDQPQLMKLNETLCLLVLGQVMLGMGALDTMSGLRLVERSAPTGAHVLLATAHVAVGALILAACVLLTLHAYKHLVQVPVPEGESAVRTPARDRRRGDVPAVRPNVSSLEPRDLLMVGGAS